MRDIQNNTHHTLSEALEQLLQNSTRGELSIGDLCSAINDKGYGLLLIILSLPSALPIPAPGYSTPFGIAIALIGIQMLGGRRTIWLPKKIKVFKVKCLSKNRYFRYIFLHIFLWNINWLLIDFINSYNVSKNLAALIVLPFLAVISYLYQKKIVFID